ncbi:MAG TPA: hypothetical protein ENI85_14655 [Deltaproteobacteria bacterium]|nr:hypothetical protein [Deltaproteobacteria bacterium]
MKNRLRDLLSFVLLVVVALAIGCSEKAEPVADAATAVDLGSDPAATILEILDDPDRFDRMEKLIAALRAVPADQADEVFEEVLAGLRHPFQDLERILIATAWARHDAPAATKWAMRRERIENVRSAVFDEAVYLWAKDDPEAIIRDMDVFRYSSAGWDKTMLRALVRGWFDSGKPNLEEFIHDLNSAGDDRQRAISEYIKVRLARDGADKMIEWAGSVPGSIKYRTYIHSRLAGDIAKTDPARAVAWCDEICDTKLGEDLPHWIAASWVLSSGADAMNWLTSRPDGLSVQTGVRASYRRFLKEDPDAAMAWMEQTTEEQRLGPVLQGPISMYVNRLSAQKEFEKAIDWAVRYLQDEYDREHALEIAARRWLREDPEAAEAWLKDAPMSEEAKVMAHQNRTTPPPPRPRKS